MVGARFEFQIGPKSAIIADLNYRRLGATTENHPIIVASGFDNMPRMEEIAASGDCVTIPQLAIRGDELPGLSGPEVAQTLHRLLQHVLEHPEDNQKARLLALLKK